MSSAAALAAILARAALDVTAVEPLSNKAALSADLAYRVQDLVVADRTKAGHQIIGAKLGLTSAAKRNQMNVDSPLYGWLTSDMLHDPGEALDCSRFIQPRCEPEIAFLLGRDLEGPDVTAAHVLAATEGVMAAIDILDSRFAGYKFTLPDVIADNSSGAGFALGGTLVDVKGLDLRLTGFVLEKNGKLVGTAAGAAVLGHPASAVAWLVRSLAGRGLGLRAGSLVLAGSPAEAVAVSPGDTVVARIDRIGTVELACK